MEKRRDYALDLIRFICAILIVLTHYEGMFLRYFRKTLFLDGKFYFGLINEMFFLLSGYLSFHTIDKIRNGLSFDKYFSAKVLRLLPLAAISTVLYALMHLVVWPQDEFSLWKVIVTCLGVNAGGPFYEMFVNSHLWFTSVLLICYAFFFIAIRLSQRLKIDWRYSCFAMVIIGIVAYANWGDDIPFLRHAAGRGYMSFFTGILLSSFLEKNRSNRAIGLTGLFTVVAFTLLLIFRIDILEYGMNYMVVFIYYPAIIIVIETPAAQKLLNRKCFGILGQIAFGIYVWHFEFNTLADIIDNMFELNVDFGSLPVEFVMVMLNIAIGFASYFILERPLNRFIKKKTSPAPAHPVKLPVS